MKNIIAIAVFPNNLELRLDVVESADLTAWLTSPVRPDFVEIDGTIIRQEPLIFMSYDKWLQSKGIHVCDKGVEHRGRCDCYRPVNMTSGENLPAIGIPAVYERAGKDGKKTMLASMKKSNPRLAKHIEEGGTFATYEPIRDGRGWVNGRWSYEQYQGLTVKEEKTRVVMDNTQQQLITRMKKAHKTRLELGVLPSKDLEGAIESVENAKSAQPKKVDKVIEQQVQDDIDDIFGLPEYLTQ